MNLLHSLSLHQSLLRHLNISPSDNLVNVNLLAGLYNSLGTKHTPTTLATYLHSLITLKPFRKCNTTTAVALFLCKLSLNEKQITLSTEELVNHLNKITNGEASINGTTAWIAHSLEESEQTMNTLRQCFQANLDLILAIHESVTRHSLDNCPNDVHREL